MIDNKVKRISLRNSIILDIITLKAIIIVASIFQFEAVVVGIISYCNLKVHCNLFFSPRSCNNGLAVKESIMNGQEAVLSNDRSVTGTPHATVITDLLQSVCNEIHSYLS